MKSLYDIPAPAKLNLFLHITGRRSDGYHLMQSVFMLVDWCDTLHFELRANGQISREDLGAALPADDLVVRAARALQTASATALGVHIAIEKRIPAQAGMGGGSSDAASTLLALNRSHQAKGVGRTGGATPSTGAFLESNHPSTRSHSCTPPSPASMTTIASP